MIKPLDSLRLGKAANSVLDGGTYTEGLPAEPTSGTSDDEADEAADSSEEEPATAG